MPISGVMGIWELHRCFVWHPLCETTSVSQDRSEGISGHRTNRPRRVGTGDTIAMAPRTLDEHERRALSQFLRLLEEESFDPSPQVEETRILRGPEGQIVVPVVLDADERSLSLALLTAHKSEQVYKQTGCRFVLAQRLRKEPEGEYYIWAGDGWQPLR